MFFIVFCTNCWSKPIPKPPENPSDHFEPVSASPDPSRPILHRFYILQLFLENKMLVVLCIPYIFIICSALEAPRPVPNCRSHFSAQTRVIESFWNPQGTSFVTKQCPKCIATKEYTKSRHNHQPAGWWFASHQPARWWFAHLQPAGWLFANHQPAGKFWKMGWEWSGELQTGAKWSARLSERF